MPFVIPSEPPEAQAASAPDNIDVPHFAVPFTISTQLNGTISADVNEQDSLEDILACVQTITVCPIGAWIDQPTFGIPSPVFANTPVGTTGITQALGTWEPRAATAASEFPDEFDAATRHINVNVTPVSPDQT